MQTASPERARFLHVVLSGALLLGAMTGLPGCASPSTGTDSPFLPPDTSGSTAPRDSALSVLTAMERTAFDSAFAALDKYGVTRHLRTEQLTPAGTTAAVRSLTIRYTPGSDSGTVQHRESVGTFRDGGLFSGIVGSRPPTERPSDLVPEALPDQPAYLAPRTREAYRYTLRTDSLRTGTPTHVVTARVRPDGTGQDQGVRYARLTLDRASQELVGLVVVRAERALLFGEESRLRLRLRRLPDGRWVPHVTRFRALVHVPFRTPRQFRTVSAYSNYVP